MFDLCLCETWSWLDIWVTWQTERETARLQILRVHMVNYRGWRDEAANVFQIETCNWNRNHMKVLHHSKEQR